MRQRGAARGRNGRSPENGVKLSLGVHITRGVLPHLTRAGLSFRALLTKPWVTGSEQRDASGSHSARRMEPSGTSAFPPRGWHAPQFFRI